MNSKDCSEVVKEHAQEASKNAEGETRHPSDPRSNIAKLGSYDPEKYVLSPVSLTVYTDESLSGVRPPTLTQGSVGLYLRPLTFELDEVPPRPTIAEIPDTVINNMVARDKAFWVDKPGANAYTLHDAYRNFGMTTVKVLPTHQDVFPRSYQYDLDCVKYRRLHACDGMKTGKPVPNHCRDCKYYYRPALTAFQLAWAKDPSRRRWRDYPDLNAQQSPEEIRRLMNEVGRPFRNEACNWYNENYPSNKFDLILRKFSK